MTEFSVSCGLHGEVLEVGGECSVCTLVERNKLKQEGEALTVDLRQAVRQIEALNSDLKEAEGAVADLMTLNDTLTGEMEALKKCDATGYDRFEAGKSFTNRLLKAEVARVREELNEIAMANGGRYNVNRSGTAKEQLNEAITKLKSTHKEV